MNAVDNRDRSAGVLHAPAPVAAAYPDTGRQIATWTAVVRLVEAARVDQSWRERAECRGMPTSAFFPAAGQRPPREVVAACGRCEVRDECLRYSLETGSSGIWAGLGDRARRRVSLRALRAS